MKLATLECIADDGSLVQIDFNPALIAAIEPTSDAKCALSTGYDDKYIVNMSRSKVKSIIESL